MKNNNVKYTFIYILISVFIFGIIKSCSFLSGFQESVIVLKVDFKQYMLNSAVNKDPVFLNLLDNVNIDTNKNGNDYIDKFSEASGKQNVHLDKYFPGFGADDASIIKRLKDSLALRYEACIKILQKRADSYELKYTKVTQNSSGSLIITLKKISDEKEAKKLFTIPGDIEFKPMYLKKEPMEIFIGMDSILAGPNYKRPDTWENEQIYNDEFELKHPLFFIVRPDAAYSDFSSWLIKTTDTSKFNRILEREDIRKFVSEDMQIVYSNDYYRYEKYTSIKVYLIESSAILTGENIIKSVYMVDKESKDPYVSIKFDDYGTYKFKDYTGKNSGKKLPVVVDGIVIMAPVIRDEITGGNCQIEGFADTKDVSIYAAIFNSGVLPLKLQAIEK
jgi:preprotein translocase subunit SecD